MRIPIEKHQVVTEQVDVLRSNVPLLIGLDFTEKYLMSADTVHNRICCPHVQIETPIVRKKGNVYLEWMKSKDILFTTS